MLWSEQRAIEKSNHRGSKYISGDEKKRFQSGSKCNKYVYLIIIAVGVNLLIRTGMIKGSYDTLLQEGEFTKEQKQLKKKTDTFSGVYWCLTTAIYLGWSFWSREWDFTWVIWPVAGVLFAALLGIVKMIIGKKE